MKACTSKPSRLALALLVASGSAYAQTPPDAGQVIRDAQPREVEPQTPSTEINLEQQPLLETQPGGEAVQLASIRFEGNTVFSRDQLMAQLDAPFEQPKDLAGLRFLANQISRYYRNQGYPFARAYLPAQKMANGELVIGVLEGRYGQITAEGELADGVQPFLNAGLAEGDLIESDQLERTTLIIGDLPGVKVSPVMRPGSETGQGDLAVQSQADKRYDGLVSVDNHGNRYTGAHRAMATINANRLFVLGDEVSLTAMYTDEDMWFGSARYALPLGYSGLRGFASFVRTDYELGTSEFEDADIAGQVDIASLGAEYPLIRSQSTNLKVSAGYEHKDITDDYGLQNRSPSKKIKAVPVTLQFDHRDSLAGGGITYGAVTGTVGDLTLESDTAKAQDDNTAETDGRYSKLHLDMARIQYLPYGFSGYVRLAGQWANNNLDSSEGFSLGGPRGIRAYPQGEASGDMGWLAQMEVRYRWQFLTPYAFYDRGRSFQNVDEWDNQNNVRDLAGAGVGMRLNYQAWSADLSAAWRTQGGEPRSDTKDKTPRVWGRVAYRF